MVTRLRPRVRIWQRQLDCNCTEVPEVRMYLLQKGDGQSGVSSIGGRVVVLGERCRKADN